MERMSSITGNKLFYHSLLGNKMLLKFTVLTFMLIRSDGDDINPLFHVLRKHVTEKDQKIIFRLTVLKSFLKNRGF